MSYCVGRTTAEWIQGWPSDGRVVAVRAAVKAASGSRWRRKRTYGRGAPPLLPAAAVAAAAAGILWAPEAVAAAAPWQTTALTATFATHGTLVTTTVIGSVNESEIATASGRQIATATPCIEALSVNDHASESESPDGHCTTAGPMGAVAAWSDRNASALVSDPCHWTATPFGRESDG